MCISGVVRLFSNDLSRLRVIWISRLAFKNSFTCMWLHFLRFSVVCVFYHACAPFGNFTYRRIFYSFNNIPPSVESWWLSRVGLHMFRGYTIYVWPICSMSWPSFWTQWNDIAHQNCSAWYADVGHSDCRSGNIHRAGLLCPHTSVATFEVLCWPILIYPVLST